MTDALNELGAHIEMKRPDCVLGWDVTHGELNLDVTRPTSSAWSSSSRRMRLAGSRRWWM